MSEATVKTATGFDSHGAPPPTNIGNEIARQRAHEAETVNVEAPEQAAIPLTPNNNPLVIPSGSNETDFAAIRNADAEYVPERITADEMRKVNARKAGTFTAREIAGAEIEAQQVDPSTGLPTEASQLRAQAAASSGASITGPDSGMGERGELVGSESTASVDAAMKQTDDRVLEATREESPLTSDLRSQSPESPTSDDGGKARGHLPEGFPGLVALEAAGEATYAKVRARVEAGTLTQIEGVGDATAEKIKEALDEAGG